MSTNGETADLMVREGIQITESVVKLAGLGAKNLAALLIALANDNQKLAGKTTLKRLIQDGDELTIFSVKKEDLDGFRMEAKSYGVLFCPIVNKMEKTGTVEIMAKAKDAQQLNRIFERMGYPAPVKEDAAKKADTRAPSASSSKERGNGARAFRSRLRQRRMRNRPSRQGSQPTKRQRTQRRKLPPQKRRSRKPLRNQHPNDKEENKMSNIGSLVAEQTRQTEEFKARKSAEREELSKMTDAGITSTTQEPEAYLHYLDVQADNPGFSTSNVLLAMQQYPDVTVFNSVKGWNAIGRSVISGETGIKVRVSDPYVMC